MNTFLVLCIALTFCYATSQFSGGSNYRTNPRLDQGTADLGFASQKSLQDLQSAGSAFGTYGQTSQVVQPSFDIQQPKSLLSGYGQMKAVQQQDFSQVQKPNYGGEFSSEQVVRPQVIQPVLDQQSAYSTKPALDVQQSASVIARPATSQILVFPVQSRQQTLNPYTAALQQRLAMQQAQLQRSGYGAYTYGQQRPVIGYATYTTQTQMDTPQVAQPLPPTVADIKCQGQSNGAIIPFDDLKGAYTCVDDGKGFEIACPRYLWWSTQVNRCEKKNKSTSSTMFIKSMSKRRSMF